MALYTIVCVDGLAGNPEITFRNIKKHFSDHVVHLVNTVGVQTIHDRVERTRRVVNECETDVILIGLSAGAIAASKVAEKDSRVKAVVLLSPAMAAQYIYFTPQLIKVFGSVAGKVYTGKEIVLSPGQYQLLIEPMEKNVVDMFVQYRIPFCGKEVLPLLKPRAISYNHTSPTLYMYGEEDRMLSPRAHKKHAETMAEYLPVTVQKIQNTGHLVLESEEVNAFSLIQEFINAL